ncbi:MAG: tetratricopeptide repeat protein [Rubrivivax sp.]
MERTLERPHEAPTTPAPPDSASDPARLQWLQGVELGKARRWPDAARAFGRAARMDRTDPLYWLNLAHAQRYIGSPTRSLAAARRCLQLEPTHALALKLAGVSLVSLHRHAEAVAVFETLDASDQTETDAMLLHASSLQALLRFGDASKVLLRLLARDPGHVKAHALLGDCCRDQGLKREAVECMRTVIALEPNHVEAHVRLSFEKRHLAEWNHFDGDLQHLQALVEGLPIGLPKVCAAFGLLSLPLAPELQLQAARSEALAMAQGVQILPPVDRASRRQSRVRLGWMSYDFRNHPVAQLLAPVLECLDRERFEVVLYSIGPDDGSAQRARLQACADRFVDLNGCSDQQAAQRIRDDGIDLLVDLMGHTRGQRMAVLARQPAPVQVSYLGFPGSTGAEFIDYLIGDPLVTPLALAPLYSEKLAQLPGCFQPNGRDRPIPRPASQPISRSPSRPTARAEAGLPDDAFVMCAFNHTYKILPEAFGVWCDVMRVVPHAVLWLKQTNDQLHDNVRREATARGVDASRIVFARNLSIEEHYLRLALADVFVDTWPYNAHTTAADALWAGVPVVTLHGNGFASRVAASCLDAAGIGELAFETVDDYRFAVVALARDPALLAGYRRHLQDQRLQMPLFDSQRQARALEALLLRMVLRWRNGLAPDHLPAMPELPALDGRSPADCAMAQSAQPEWLPSACK